MPSDETDTGTDGYLLGVDEPVAGAGGPDRIVAIGTIEGVRDGRVS